MKLTDFLSDVGRPVAYYPSLRRITGSTNATILLCQFIYWKGKEADADGWLYKESDEIETETGLSYGEQKTARRLLVDAGLIEEHYARLDHQMKFRLNLEAINAKWGMSESSIPESGKPQFGNNENLLSLNESETTTEKTSNDEKPDLVDLELQKKAKQDGVEPALQAFERDMQTPGNWSWYPTKTTQEKEWRELRDFVVKLYAENPNCFAEYNTWRNEPYAKGAMSNRQIKNYPSDFQASWSDFVIRTKMYGNKNQKPESNVKRSTTVQYEDDGTPITF